MTLKYTYHGCLWRFHKHFAMTNCRMFKRFQPDHEPTDNWTYSSVICMIAVLLFPILMAVHFNFQLLEYDIYD